MSKVASSFRFVEVPHVIGSTEDIWDTVASVGAVRHLSVTMVGQDRGVRLCFGLSFGLDEGRRQEDRSQDQHPVEVEGDARM